MKKFLLLLISFFFLNTLNAQDFIIMKNGDEIKAKVQEVGVWEVKYKFFDNPDGPLYTILKSDIFMIKYENGSKEVYTAENVTQPKDVTVIPPVSQQKPRVIIYRVNSPKGVTVVYDVYVETKLLTKVSNNTYFETEMNPGMVTFSAMTEPPKVTVSMNLEACKTYYIKCGIATGWFVGRPTLEFVSETTGAYETEKMRK